MARKTFPVEGLTNMVNFYLAQPDEALGATPEAAKNARAAVAGILESVLFQTDNYAGYRLRASEYLPADEQTLENVLRPDYDGTRRQYI